MTPRDVETFRTYTPEELADWSLIVNGYGGLYVMREANGHPLTIPAGYPGAGQQVHYGYLTPREVAYARKPMREAAE